MRFLKILTVALVLTSSTAFAKSYCGVEETLSGRELTISAYLLVAKLFCKNDSDFARRADAYPFSDSAANLNKSVESFFNEKLKSGSCRSEVGNLEGRGAKGALDNWLGKVANQYSSQASQNVPAFCRAANNYLNQHATASQAVEPIKKSKQSARLASVESTVERATIKSIGSSKAYYSPSSSYFSASLYRPTPVAFINSYNHLLPTIFYPQLIQVIPVNPANGVY